MHCRLVASQAQGNIAVEAGEDELRGLMSDCIITKVRLRTEPAAASRAMRMCALQMRSLWTGKHSAKLKCLLSLQQGCVDSHVSCAASP